ncbi:MAG: 50S ribosomal protein P1 [Candidatus Woesearchaeota archaeon]
MEYVYAALLLHKAGKKVDETSIRKVLEAAGISPDEAKIKALVASLEGVDIDKAIESAQVVTAAPSAAAPAQQHAAEEKKAEKEEDKKSEEAAAVGLSALFG